MTPRSGDGEGDATGAAVPRSGDPAGAGDIGAGDIDLTKLYQENEPALRRRLTRLGRRQDAADLAHDAFVKTIATPPTERQNPNSGAAYLHTVTNNVLRDRWRRERRAAAGNVRLLADAKNHAPAADALALSGLQGAVVRSAVAALAPEQQDVLRLRIVEGRSSEEVAALLGRTPAAVRQVQHRALATLRRDLTAQGWAPERYAGSGPATDLKSVTRGQEEKS